MGNRRRVRVLVADDMDDFRFLLRVVLEDDGRFEVVGEASDGKEAIELAGKHQPDVVLLDLAMPVMDGLQAIPEVRKVAPDSKIVVLSGFAETQMAEQALLLSAAAYIEKGEELRTITCKLLDVHRSPGT